MIPAVLWPLLLDFLDHETGRCVCGDSWYSQGRGAGCQFINCTGFVHIECPSPVCSRHPKTFFPMWRCALCHKYGFKVEQGENPEMGQCYRCLKSFHESCINLYVIEVSNWQFQTCCQQCLRKNDLCLDAHFKHKH